MRSAQTVQRRLEATFLAGAFLTIFLATFFFAAAFAMRYSLFQIIRIISDKSTMHNSNYIVDIENAANMPILVFRVESVAFNPHFRV